MTRRWRRWHLNRVSSVGRKWSASQSRSSGCIRCIRWWSFHGAHRLAPAEVAGLDIGDVSLLGSAGEIRVRRTRTLTIGRGWVTSPPKTKRSRREYRSYRPSPWQVSPRISQRIRVGSIPTRRFCGRDNTGSHDYNPERFFDPGTFYRRVLPLQRSGLGSGTSDFTICVTPTPASWQAPASTSSK